MSKVENKVDIRRSFGEVVLSLELPSVERLFKGLSQGEVQKVTDFLEERMWYFPRDKASKMQIYSLDPDTIDELMESFSWIHPNTNQRYEFNFDPHVGNLLTGNRINVAFLRFQGIEKNITLNFKGIFNTQTLEIFSEGMKAFIKNLIDFNKPLLLKFEVPEGEDSQVETITI